MQDDRNNIPGKKAGRPGTQGDIQKEDMQDDIRKEQGERHEAAKPAEESLDDMLDSADADAEESSYPQDDLWQLAEDGNNDDIRPEESRELARKSRFDEHESSGESLQDRPVEQPGTRTDGKGD